MLYICFNIAKKEILTDQDKRISFNNDILGSKQKVYYHLDYSWFLVKITREERQSARDCYQLFYLCNTLKQSNSFTEIILKGIKYSQNYAAIAYQCFFLLFFIF